MIGLRRCDDCFGSRLFLYFGKHGRWTEELVAGVWDRLDDRFHHRSRSARVDVVSVDIERLELRRAHATRYVVDVRDELESLVHEFVEFFTERTKVRAADRMQ